MEKAIASCNCDQLDAYQALRQLPYAAAHCQVFSKKQKNEFEVRDDDVHLARVRPSFDIRCKALATPSYAAPRPRRSGAPMHRLGFPGATPPYEVLADSSLLSFFIHLPMLFLAFLEPT